MKKISSPQLTNIGTSFAVAALILVGAYNGLVAPTFNWLIGGIVVAGLVVVLPTIALLRERYKIEATAWAYFFASHSLSFLALVFIAGVDNPFISLWVVMLVVSYLELGWVAFCLSAVSLGGAMVLGRQISPEIEPTQRGVLSIVGIVITVFLSIFALVIARIASNERNARKDLEKVTAQEREQFHKLETVMNSLADVILALGKDGKVTAQNAAAMAFFDTNNSLEGRSIEELLPLTTLDGSRVLYREMMRNDMGSAERDDIVRKTPDGEEMRLQVQLRPIAPSYTVQLASLAGYIVIVRDITKQKTLEEEKDDFISVASHELRTPIAIMEAGLANMITLQQKGIKQEELLEFTEDAHRQALQLAHVVNDLSTVLKAEHDALSLQSVRFNDIIQDIAREFSKKAQRAQLDFSLELDEQITTIETDPAYLKEVLRNLFDNALKYTKAGSVIVESHYSGGVITCRVTDTGIGIAKADQQKIFDKFYQAEDFHTRETGGTGLGLYIAKKLVEKMGGSIGVKSHLGEGATFFFSLPSSPKNTM